jgi:hypothetical protein
MWEMIWDRRRQQRQRSVSLVLLYKEAGLRLQLLNRILLQSGPLEGVDVLPRTSFRADSDSSPSFRWHKGPILRAGVGIGRHAFGRSRVLHVDSKGSRVAPDAGGRRSLMDGFCLALQTLLTCHEGPRPQVGSLRRTGSNRETQYE